jgi:hypothetical protein
MGKSKKRNKSTVSEVQDLPTSTSVASTPAATTPTTNPPASKNAPDRVTNAHLKSQVEDFIQNKLNR